jgi:beta-fructofuranosidase
MVHWIRLPIAIVPSEPYDINGIWTGSTTIVNGTPTIIYTGINAAGIGVQCLAVASNLSDATLTNWTKSPLNPLITSPEGRDPSAAFKDSQNNYYLIYGYGTELGGQVLLFTSKDFRKWTYLHPFHSNHNGDFWDCPDLFPLSNRMVLKAGLLDHDFWALGNIDPVKLIFTPINGDLGEFTQLIDYGRFYASKSFYDPINNQQVIVGWTAEQDNLGPQRGWQGMLTLPRAVFLSSDGLQLRTRPIEELKTLRDPNTHLQYTDIAIEREFPFELIPNVKGNQIEIVVNWQFPMNQVESNFHLFY